MSDSPVRVAVLSPQPIVQAGVIALLSENLDRVEIVPVLSVGSELDPDVVLYDAIGLLTSDGADLDRLINDTASHILIISNDLRPDLASRALQHGAQGYFSIAADALELVSAVESAATGWVPGDPGDDPTVGSGTSAAQMLRTGNNVDLSGREASTLTYIAQGLSNREIAEREYISVNSVKTYIRTAYRKIGVNTRSQAVSWAIQNGIDPRPDTEHDSRGD